MLSILFSKVLWLGIGAVLLFGGIGWVLYERYLHPTWRKDRRGVRACDKAFEQGTYELVRIHLGPYGPSGADLLPTPIGPSETSKHFTYQINVDEGIEPDLSDTTREEARLVRRYLHRDSFSGTHYGKEVLRSMEESASS